MLVSEYVKWSGGDVHDDIDDNWIDDLFYSVLGYMYVLQEN